jgi:hypothetical protein
MQILKNERNRLAFRFGRASAFKSTSDVVDQLQQQLCIERACTAELKREVDWLLQQLGEARAALDDKTLLLRLVGTPCSATVH